MIDHIKQIKRDYSNKHKIIMAYRNDCRNYLKWQYHNPDLKTKEAIEAKILRHTHILEKGMSLSNPKPKFGVQRASELLNFLDEFEKYGFKPSDSTVFQNALGVIHSYLAFHRERGFEPEEIIKRVQKWNDSTPVLDENYGICSVTFDELNKQIHGEFPEFFNSRHAIRQFSDEMVTEDEIKKAVAVAMRAPSACNRQSCKVYFFNDKEVNKRIGDVIPGNTGFSEEVKNYLVVTSNISSFYDDFERNQAYVDGGIFTMALAEALHYYGIGSCILQNGETEERDRKVRTICKVIPENEKVIVFIAIGHYKKEFTYAMSHRKKIEDVLIIN